MRQRRSSPCRSRAACSMTTPLRRRTQVVKGEVCKTSMQRFESARRLSRLAGVAQSAEAADLKSVQWGFESLHQHQAAAYAYLLGMYLGDGHIARHPRTFRLRIFLGKGQVRVIDDCVHAIRSLRPRRPVGCSVRGNCVTLSSYWSQWPVVFPQHGPGKKHLRKIELKGWQADIVERMSDRFVRGCLDSDGCRHRRIVNGKNYPAYSSKNSSADILALFCAACNRIGIRYRRSNRVTISIARRPDVARLDVIAGYDGPGRPIPREPGTVTSTGDVPSNG